MKLRLRGSSLRLRITPEELVQLVAGKAVTELVEFGPDGGVPLSYELVGDAAASFVHAVHAGQTVRVVVPVALVHQLATTDQVGITAEQKVGEGRALQILVEKDFRCLVPRDGEPNDGFARPADVPGC
jgi:hypothetical protein